ncbi:MULTISPECIES: hypothetical protein [Carnobacterium]|uniref:hypothetical protein n=1 Tax=Carnobacterium TaxID=2747 RepID=UPI001D694D44|nr:hypothetical protein [Carnobacterium maltaromaticum]MCC4313470.1 hypothetical protein [Carnobacterium maltaromaticum]
MSRMVIRPAEIITKTKYDKIDIKDAFIIIGSAGIGFLFTLSKQFVFSYLEFPFVLAFPITLYILLSPSEIPKKKTYQIAKIVLLKDRKTYRPIKRPK